MSKMKKSKFVIASTVAVAAGLLMPSVAHAESVSQGVNVTPQKLIELPELIGGKTVKIKTGAAPGQIVMGNLTVTGTVGNGYTTMFPCDEGIPVDDKGRPNQSVSNFTANSTVPNFAAVKADKNGEVCVYTPVFAHVIWDQSVITSSFGAGLKPARLVDTRAGWAPYVPPGQVGLPVVKDGPVEAGKMVKFNVLSKDEVGLNLEGTTVLGNLTVTGAKGNGFTTIFPCIEGHTATLNGVPNVSVNNYTAGKTVANFTAVKADKNGDVCVYTSNAAHLVFDRSLVSSPTFSSKNGPVEGVIPFRALDTRINNWSKWDCLAWAIEGNVSVDKKGSCGVRDGGLAGTRVPAHTVLVVEPEGLYVGGGDVRLPVEPTYSTVIGNLTVTSPRANGFTTVFDCVEGPPIDSNGKFKASVNNFRKGQTVANTVAASTKGGVCVYTSAEAHLIWDTMAFSDKVEVKKPVRIIDTRLATILPQ